MEKANYWSPKDYFEGPMIYDWVHLLPVSPGAKLLYAKLAYMADQEETAWPSQGYLATYLNVGERTVRNYLSELKKAGVIEVEQRGMNRSNVYRFVLNEAVFNCVEERLSLRKSKEKVLKELLSLCRFAGKDISTHNRKDISVHERKDVSVYERKDVSVHERKDVSVPNIIEKNKGKEQGKRIIEHQEGAKNDFSFEDFEVQKKEIPTHNHVVPAKFSLVGFDQTLAYEQIVFNKHRGAGAVRVKEALQNYATYRIELGSPMTKSQLIAMRSVMEQYDDDFICASISRAISSGWKGINFESQAAEKLRNEAYEARQKAVQSEKKEYAYERLDRVQKELEKTMLQRYANSDDPRDHMTVTQLKELEWKERKEALAAQKRLS